MIDTHSHLFTTQFDSDREEVLRRAEEAGVEKIVLPNIDLDTVPSMMELYLQHPDLCYPTMGLHPCDVDANYEGVLDEMEEKFIMGPIKDQLVGIGETGLDYYWDASYVEQQKVALRRHCGWARSLDLPIILHTRESTQDCIDIIREERVDKLVGVFHCFSGTREEAEQIMDLGFYLGIGGTITFKKNPLREWIHEIPLKYIVLETDAPYLAPMPYRGKRNESAYIQYVRAELAELYGVSEKEVDRSTTQNARALFFSELS